MTDPAPVITAAFRRRWVALGLAGLLLLGCSSEDDTADGTDDAAEQDAADDTTAAADDDTAADDTADDDTAAEDEPAEEGDSSGGAVEIVSVADGFAPSPATVTAGTEVTWTNADGIDHTVTAEDDSFDSGAIAGGGTYSYFCAIHPSMTGELVVE